MRLLIVEDQSELREFLFQGMKEELFAVDTSSDGEEAIFLGKTNDYDLIILDLNLPRKNGLQVCTEIRKSGKKMPILILSVESETKNKIELINSGADDYLTKPFSFDELLARVRALLRRPKNIHLENYSLDDLTLNPSNHDCRRGKEKLRLTRKEFMLLQFLFQHLDTVVSRSKILEHVWDIHADPFTNSIETHILSLRKKINRENKRKLIHTVSGTGYKLSKHP
jgi:DNA-binding response OmpR family regulator